MSRKNGAYRVLVIALALALALALIGPQALAAEEPGPWGFRTEMCLYGVALRAGAEYSLGDSWGLRGSLGASVISPLLWSYSLVGVWHLAPEAGPLLLDLELGLVEASFNVLEPIVDLDPDIDWASAYWAPGLCLAVGFRTRGGHRLSVRGGVGVLFGYDPIPTKAGTWQGPDLIPSIAIAYGFGPDTRGD